MKTSELKELIRNTDFFYEECRVRKLLSNTEEELKSILTFELLNKSKEETYNLVSNIIDFCKEEILNQDKMSYRTVVTEVDSRFIKYIIEHKHPIGTFITELENKDYMMICTVGGINTRRYFNKDEMLADLILKECFNVFYDTTENALQIRPLKLNVDKLFGKNILEYIKENIDGITEKMLEVDLLQEFKDKNIESMFKNYLDVNLKEIFVNKRLENPQYIKIGDVIKTRYSDRATVIGIDTKNGTLKLDTEVQKDITVFTNVISYKDKDFIKEIEKNNIEMEVS